MIHTGYRRPNTLGHFGLRFAMSEVGLSTCVDEFGSQLNIFTPKVRRNKDLSLCCKLMIKDSARLLVKIHVNFQ
jgi:hypothetical protein